MDRPQEAKQDLYARFLAQLEKNELTSDDVPQAGTEDFNMFCTELGYSAVEESE